MGCVGGVADVVPEAKDDGRSGGGRRVGSLRRSRGALVIVVSEHIVDNIFVRVMMENKLGLYLCIVNTFNTENRLEVCVTNPRNNDKRLFFEPSNTTVDSPILAINKNNIKFKNTTKKFNHVFVGPVTAFAKVAPYFVKT